LTKNLFNSRAQQQEYNANGFAVVDGFNVEPLLKFAEQTALPKIDGLNATHYHGSADQNQVISKQLFELGNEFLNQTFADYKNIIAHFVFKSKDASGFFNLHQDWSIVDESKHQVAHLWVAMQDTDEHNGGMFVIPKSHLLFNNLRSGSLGIPFLKLDEDTEKVICKLKLKRGEGLVYNPALFHGSFLNESENVRKAALFAICDKDAPLVYYHKSASFAQNGVVKVYSLTSKHLLSELKQLSAGEIPSDSELLREVKYTGLLPEAIDGRILVEGLNSQD
jgi:hypothetical protein